MNESTGGVLRVANCSGFYGDRLSAAKEMVEGGPIDVLTGDWLAEVTMFILSRTMERRADGGYARTFLNQIEEVLGTCLDQGVKIVSNAGGLTPDACAGAVEALAMRLGLSARVASVTGDDLLPRLPDLLGAGQRLDNLDTGEAYPSHVARPVTANAYLGGRPIAAALTAGADIVVTGRVTDAALTVGPGIWRFDWSELDLDALAGAVVAGHLIECGCQVTGGNYSFFDEVPGRERLGFPIAEIERDGSCTITKHAGTGGLVSVGTVTAQLLYETSGVRYVNPDVIARLDTVRLSQSAKNRVRVYGTRGEAPPDCLKVAITFDGGYSNSMTVMLTGLDVPAKAVFAEQAVWAGIPAGRNAFENASVDLIGPGADGTVSEQPTMLRFVVTDPDRAKVGRAFSSAVVETGLSSVPGFYTLGPPRDATSIGEYWPTLIDRQLVDPVVTVDGYASKVAAPAPNPHVFSDMRHDNPVPPKHQSWMDDDIQSVRLGSKVGARSGDKGGNVNVGLWTRTALSYEWLVDWLTVDQLRQLVPQYATLAIERHLLPNVLAVNFVIVGALGRGASANPLLDAQGKSVAEQIRSRIAPMPGRLLSEDVDDPTRSNSLLLNSD
jgi:hypothetical protein